MSSSDYGTRAKAYSKSIIADSKSLRNLFAWARLKSALGVRLYSKDIVAFSTAF